MKYEIKANESNVYLARRILVVKASNGGTVARLNFCHGNSDSVARS